MVRSGDTGAAPGIAGAPEAVVLAAGLGLRMRPVTLDWPKPAIPFLNRPILHWTLEALERSGIGRVFVNLHHRPDRVRAAAESYPGTLEIVFSYEPEILGTAGLFGPLKPMLTAGSFVAVNGDVLCGFPFAALSTALARNGTALAVLALRKGSSAYTGVELSPRGLVTAFGRGELMYAGAYAARRELLDHLGSGPAELVRDLLAPILSSGAVRGVVFDEPWDDLGGADSYLAASLREVRRMALGLAAVPAGSRLLRVLGQDVLAHETAVIDEGALFTGPAVIGGDARVGEGARVGDCVLLPGTRLGPGQILERCVASISGVLSVNSPRRE